MDALDTEFHASGRPSGSVDIEHQRRGRWAQRRSACGARGERYLNEDGINVGYREGWRWMLTITGVDVDTGILTNDFEVVDLG